MSYLVLALGAFLSLCGAFAIDAGYGIIQVERGWTGVIAGATALSGGIVTIALGVILHKLSSLHALLKTGKGLTPLPRELEGQETSEPHQEQSLGFNPEASMAEAGLPPAATPSAAGAPAASLRTWPQRPTRASFAPARNFLKSRGTLVPAARGIPESDFALPKIPLISRDALRGAQAAPEPPFEPGVGMPAGAAAKAGDAADTRPASAPAVEAPAEAAWNPDSEPGLFDEDIANEPPIEAPFPELPFDYRLSEAQSAPRVIWPAETASIYAILSEELRIEPDPALAAGKESTERSPEAIEPANLDAAPPLMSEAVPAGDPEASPEPSPPAAPFASEEGLAIVGRYDSEGTSYVMYADGSIEARTEHAVLHFKSMVELKAFMESRAQTPQE